MEYIAREVLAGIAIGGFTAAVVKANLFALKALWHANCLAAETAWEMFQGYESKHIDRERERRRWQQRENES